MKVVKKFTLGRKLQMTQYFDESGAVHPATVIKVIDPAIVVRVKSEDKDGYNAVQVGFGTQKEHRVNKPQLGEWKDKGVFEVVREFTPENIGDFKDGDKLNPFEMFEVGDKVHVSGTSKGKGFQGVVKRHGFAGGPRSHGQKHSERKPGSIGSTGPQRVFKGTRMAGRMGGERVTVKGLKVLDVDKENGVLVIRGAVPGPRGGLLEVYVK